MQKFTIARNGGNLHPKTRPGHTVFPVFVPIGVGYLPIYRTFIRRAASTARTRYPAGSKYSPHPLSGGLQVQPAPVIRRAASTARTRYPAGCKYSPHPFSAGCKYSPHPFSGGLQVQPAPVIRRAASAARTRFAAGSKYSPHPLSGGCSTARTRYPAGCKYSPHPLSGGLPVTPAPVIAGGAAQVQPAPVIRRAASTARTRYPAGCKYSPHPLSGGLQVQPAPVIRRAAVQPAPVIRRAANTGRTRLSKIYANYFRRGRKPPQERRLCAAETYLRPCKTGTAQLLEIQPRYLIADATAGPSSGSTRRIPARCVLPTQNFTWSPESSTKARRMLLSRGIR